MRTVKKECKYSELLVQTLQKYNEERVLRIIDMPDKFLDNLREAYKEPGLPRHLHDFIHGGPSTHKKHILLPVKNQKGDEKEKGLLYEFWNFTEQSFLNTNEELTVVLHPNRGYCPIQDFVHKDRKYLVNDDGYVLDPKGGLMKDRVGGVSLVAWFVNSPQFKENIKLVKYVKMGNKEGFIKDLSDTNNLSVTLGEFSNNSESFNMFVEPKNRNNRNGNIVKAKGQYNSILDFNFHDLDLELLKELKTRSLEHANRVYGANRQSGDKILLYFHFPYVEKTVTLHLHIRINSPQHNLELARSFMLEDIITGLETDTINKLIQKRIKTDCGYLLYKKALSDKLLGQFLIPYKKDAFFGFNTTDTIKKYYDNAKYEIIDNPFRISNFNPKIFFNIPYTKPTTYKDYLNTKFQECYLPKVQVFQEESNFQSEENFFLVEGFPRKKTKKKKLLKKNKKKSLKKKVKKINKKRKKLLNKIKK